MKRNNGEMFKEGEALGRRKRPYQAPSLIIHGNLDKITLGKSGKPKDGLTGAKPHS
jgi:hypothetical protein